jgi:hypothetical protein
MASTYDVSMTAQVAPIVFALRALQGAIVLSARGIAIAPLARVRLLLFPTSRRGEARQSRCKVKVEWHAWGTESAYLPLLFFGLT